jgi:hypothetical protein
MRPHLLQRGGEVRVRLGGSAADARDDLDRALEQLVLRLRVPVLTERRAHLRQDRRGRARQLTGVAVDQLELDLDPE